MDKNFMYYKSEGPASILKKLINENASPDVVSKGINYKRRENFGTVTKKTNRNNIEEPDSSNLTEDKLSVAVNAGEEDRGRWYAGSSELDNTAASTASFYDNVIPEKLQEAIIWTEILEKPVSRRHRKR